MSDEDTTTYRFSGLSGVGDRTQRLVISGTSDEPEVYADRGKTVDLTEEQFKAAKAMGAKLRKVSDEKDDESDSEGDGEAETPADQQKSQVASGAQGPPADPKKSNQPGTQGAGKKN